MKQRDKRAQAAQETIDILKNGYYEVNGATISIENDQRYCVENTLLIQPDDPLDYKAEQLYETEFVVENKTTLKAVAENLSDEALICLNFASAKNPGGGFLGGAQAQEESLARASGLYPSISQMTEMYDSNRSNRSLLYLDYMIYSPRVPVFKTDYDQLRSEPFLVSIITAPAPNKGAIENNQPHDLPKVEETMRRRVKRVLALALQKGYKNIVLGAWGCGVFRNDPAMVADIFEAVLKNGGEFEGKFKKVIFGVLDRRKGTVFPEFEKRFTT
ncbi:MAG: TIGR02452 family protein [Bacteroidota bacterium]